MSAERCSECQAILAGSRSVEGLCSACLLTLALRGVSDDVADTREDPLPRAGRAESPSPSPAGRTGSRRTLEPLGSGFAAPFWAMPAELLRQAARRLALASFGVAVCFAVGIILNNLVTALGWYTFAHPAVKNVVAGTMVAISAAMTYVARTRRFTPRQLLWTGLAFEVVISFGISLQDHLEPLPLDTPLASISWVCVWIAMFPVMIPAPAKWALAAGVAS